MPEDGQVQIPGFRIEHELGRGAMGVVYHAHEEALGREVALKLLRAGFGDGEDLRRRFEREVSGSTTLHFVWNSAKAEVEPGAPLENGVSRAAQDMPPFENELGNPFPCPFN